MFSSYDNINTCIIPSNTHITPTKEYITLDNEIPRKEYNIKGEFIGYSWNYGDDVTLNISANTRIKVHRDSLVFNAKGNKPAYFTYGYRGMQAYNLIDNKSWTCLGIISGIYVWVEDDKITYDKYGTKEIEFITNMEDKEIVVAITDFRKDILHTFNAVGVNNIQCGFSDLYDVMKSGVYYGYVSVRSTDGNEIKTLPSFTISIKNEVIDDETRQ